MKKEQRYMAIAAAWLLSQGKSRKEISAKLNRGLPEVARLIKLAKEAGYLSHAPAFLRHHVNSADWAAVQRRFFGEADFTDKLVKFVPPNVPFEALTVLGNYAEFLHGAAVHVCHLLHRARIAGVLWGRTVHLLVENIRACGEHVDRDVLGRIECVPLCGDPIHLLNQRRLEYSASWLAVELEHALRRPGYERENFPCLIGVPAYLSRAVRAGARADEGSWVSFLHQIPGYEAIFGKKPGQRERLADQVDTVIMGAGIIGPGLERWNAARPDSPATGDLIEERLQQEAISEEQLAGLIYGDLGGVLLERPGLTPDQRKLVEDLNQGWTGMRRTGLHGVVERARRYNRAGIILVATSAAKADVVGAAIQLGLVNRLVVDEPLKTRLLELTASWVPKR